MNTSPDPRILRYLNCEMPPEEEAAFEQEIDQNESLAAAVRQAETVLQAAPLSPLQQQLALAAEVYQPGGIRDQLQAPAGSKPGKWLWIGGGMLVMIAVAVFVLFPGPDLRPVANCLSQADPADLRQMRQEYSGKGLAAIPARQLIAPGIDSLLASNPRPALQLPDAPADLPDLGRDIRWLQLRADLFVWQQQPVAAKRVSLLTRMAAFAADSSFLHRKQALKLKSCLEKK